MYSDKIKQLNRAIDDVLAIIHESDLTPVQLRFHKNELDKLESELAKYITLEVYYLVKEADFI